MVSSATALACCHHVPPHLEVIFTQRKLTPAEASAKGGRLWRFVPVKYSARLALHQPLNITRYFHHELGWKPCEGPVGFTVTPLGGALV